MDKHPHEKVLDKIAELLKLAYDNAHKPIATEKAKLLEVQLDALEKEVEEFKKISDTILEGSGLTDYVYQTIKEDKNSSILTDTERKLLARAEFLKEEALLAAQDLTKAAHVAKAEGKDLVAKKKEKKEKSPQSRKGKFRSFGGVKNWKPL